MLQYYNEEKDKNGFVYSVDMVRITFNLPTDDNKKRYLERYFGNDARTDMTVYSACFRPMKYRTLVNIDYGTTTATIGFGFNGPSRSDMLRGFIEFNPNKIMNGNKQAFNYDYDILTMYCNSFEIARWDLAIDIPIARENILVSNPKGKVYKLERYSESNKTEWLGVRNSHGYTKIYNKALESQVDAGGVVLENLTRVEITIALDSITEILKQIPDVYTLGTDTEGEELSETQKALIMALRECENPIAIMSRIPYRVRKKIEPFVIGTNKRLLFDNGCIVQTYANANAWLKDSIKVLPIKVNNEWIKVDHTPFDDM